MKIQINLKDPNGFYESVFDAVSDELIDLNLTSEEKKNIRETRMEEIRTFLRKWVSGGEYVSLEFDTETGTAKVLED